MRKMLYMTVPATMLLSSCASVPYILEDAELAVEAADVAIKAEQGAVQEINQSQVEK